jgi:hypothetical protein
MASNRVNSTGRAVISEASIRNPPHAPTLETSVFHLIVSSPPVAEEVKEDGIAVPVAAKIRGDEMLGPL